MSERWRGRKRLGKNICVGTEGWFGLRLPRSVPLPLPLVAPAGSPAREPSSGSKDSTNIIKCKCRGFRAILTRTSQFTDMPAPFYTRRAFTVGLICRPSVFRVLVTRYSEIKISARRKRERASDSSSMSISARWLFRILSFPTYKSVSQCLRVCSPHASLD